MDADKRRLELNEITEKIIGAAFKVGTALGPGFLEKVYENALAYELRKMNLSVLQQHALQVRYDDIIVGDYCADLLIENRVLVELKAVRAFDDIHLAQCLNYLKATNLSVCLLINFGKPKVEVKRIVHDF